LFGALGVAVCALIVVLVWQARGPRILIPDEPCTHPPTLQTFQGVTLQPLAMKAFQQAQRLAGEPIDVVQSYRSCSKQAAACDRICGNPEGCAGTCASPGASYHQLGAAIDISAADLKKPRIVQALQQAGWCEPLPSSDPGHFSYGGCH
jgi:hypothetical protein